MNLVRDLERRLEQLVEGVAGKVFRGSVHPAELAARLARESDLTRRDGPLGPVAPNHFTIHLNQRDVGALNGALNVAQELETAVEVTALARGWRLEGPASVALQSDPSISAGMIRVEAQELPGDRTAWAALVGTGDQQAITVNRCLIGRAADADVTLLFDSVSRRHALIWHEDERVWIQDLKSANGTFVDGVPATEPVETQSGQRVTFGAIPYVLQIAPTESLVANA